MFKFQSSIRQKIIFSYLTILLFLVGFLALVLIEVVVMQRNVKLGEMIFELSEFILEIRRFEKNFFLYGKESDLDKNMKYINRVIYCFKKNDELIKSNAHALQLMDIKSKLVKYKELILRLKEIHIHKSDADTFSGMEVLKEKIRGSGKEVTILSEELSQNEREYIKEVLSGITFYLFITIVIFAALATVIGNIVYKMIIAPLKQLEKSVSFIVKGGPEEIQIESKDKEIISLTNAFNNMLRRLETKRRKLFQSEKLASLGTLLSGVAHELNNPLSNISSSCQILMEEIEEDNMEFKKELLLQIDEQTDRAKDIVLTLLEYSSKKEFKKESIQLKELIEQVMVFTRIQSLQGLEVEIEISDEIVIAGDRQRIQHVFLNIIKNAIDAVGEKGLVSVKAERKGAGKSDEGVKDAEVNYVHIEIRDTGLGIDSAIIKRIFDPFFTNKEVGNGYGLGLYLVYEIIKEHDGEITVESKLNEGTTFFIKLPAHGSSLRSEAGDQFRT